MATTRWPMLVGVSSPSRIRAATPRDAVEIGAISDEAIASGVLRVSYDGRTVEYRSLTDLRARCARSKPPSIPAGGRCGKSESAPIRGFKP